METTAKSIDTYITKHHKKMTSAEQQVTALASTWQGDDSLAFKNQWGKLTSQDSTSKNMTKSLEKYAEFLRYAASQYKDAQSKAVNRANRL